MNYKMIVLDLDGTLTNRDKVITEKTRHALMEAQKRGKKVVLASGRPTYGVVPLAEELELENTAAVFCPLTAVLLWTAGQERCFFKKSFRQRPTKKSSAWLRRNG